MALESAAVLEVRGLIKNDSEPTTAGGSAWTFLTNHSHVLICLAQDPGMRLRDVADKVGITERARAAYRRRFGNGASSRSHQRRTAQPVRHQRTDSPAPSGREAQHTEGIDCRDFEDPAPACSFAVRRGDELLQPRIPRPRKGVVSR